MFQANKNLKPCLKDSLRCVTSVLCPSRQDLSTSRLRFSVPLRQAKPDVNTEDGSSVRVRPSFPVGSESRRANCRVEVPRINEKVETWQTLKLLVGNKDNLQIQLEDPSR